MHSGANLATALRLAIDSIRAHKLRSSLTLLGVMIGVSSVILVGSAIEGLGAYAEESTAKAFGTDSYLIAQIASTGNLTRKQLSEKMRNNKRIRAEEIDYLRIVTGDSVLYTPYRQRTDDVKYREEMIEAASVIGVSYNLPEIRDVTLTDGRFFTEQEERTSQFVAVIGDEVRATLFPNVSPLGKIIKVRGFDFRVIGVQEKLGSAFGRSQDNSVYITDAAMTRLYGPGQSIAFFGRARPESGLELEEALDLTRAALRTRFRTAPGKEDNFDFITPDSIRTFLDQMLGMIAAVVVPVTLISLVVGGIVIMNIMLVSVTERTREIGIRKSLGARRSDILKQFLIEAVLMAGAGGVLGILLGALLTSVLGPALDIKLTITLTYVLLAIFVSSTVGILSGWYPAARAAKLDPVEALRAE